MISTRSPSRNGRRAHCPRGTTSSFTATATPRVSTSIRCRSSSTETVHASSLQVVDSPFTMICMPFSRGAGPRFGVRRDDTGRRRRSQRGRALPLPQRTLTGASEDRRIEGAVADRSGASGSEGQAIAPPLRVARFPPGRRASVIHPAADPPRRRFTPPPIHPALSRTERAKTPPSSLRSRRVPRCKSSPPSPA